MTNYEYLMNKAIECNEKALKFKKDKRLADFYKNAGNGYKSKAYDLLLEDAVKQYEHK